MEQSKRIFIHNGGLFFNYQIEQGIYFNGYSNCEQVYEHCWYVGVKLEPIWFDFNVIYYDGFELKSLTVCAITLMKGFSWNDEKLDD